MNREILHGDDGNQSALAESRSCHKPCDMIWTASSLFRAFNVNNARNRVCSGTLPDLLRREASKALRSDSDGETVTMVWQIDNFFWRTSNFFQSSDFRGVCFNPSCLNRSARSSVYTTILPDYAALMNWRSLLDESRKENEGTKECSHEGG
jgi:hypothetical protein